ncbi:MAG: tRNA (guanine(46)-N(7))-methyltransferase TrmB [Rhodospirillaceae bacterium]|nr:tRNA (guanine(46)-N(7))-methyltransferase TrmB [Rhodospirillaceae bacterium]
MKTPSTPDPVLRVYGRRKGKPLKPQRQGLLDALLPTLTLPPPRTGAPLDPFAQFEPRPRQVWLEVGFGGGEHLAAQAAANPDIGLIGCDVFLNGVASLVRHVAARQLANVRIWPDDARALLPHLPEASLARLFVLFPDPWPKARHAKRRVIGPDTVDGLARVLADGSQLRVASDHPIYVAWALAHLTAHPAFAWQVSGPDSWRARPADQVETRYEAKARAQGRTPVFMTFLRRPRTPTSTHP